MIEEILSKKKNELRGNNILILKNLYFNNYHSLSSFNITFLDLNFFFKILNLKSKIKHENLTTYTKPHSFLYFNKSNTNIVNPYTNVIHLLFKQYSSVSLFGS